MKITVVPHNPNWPLMFEKEASQLMNIMGGNALQVFHIGSTAVPGLSAKPIIDMMPVVRNIEEIDACTTAFEAMGYEVLGEFGIPGRCYMRKGGDERTHQLHVFQYDNTADILRHIAFRDYLRCHPDVCAEYGALKSGLAERYPLDIEAYCDGKDAFVKRVECDALQWYWGKLGS